MHKMGMVGAGLFLFALCASGAACVPIVDCLEGKACGGNGGGGGADTQADGGAGNGDLPPVPQCTSVGKPHLGLGGEDLAAKGDGSFSDHARVKPFSALAAEYTRALPGTKTPSRLPNVAGTFGLAGDRWYVEPLASAALLSAAFDVAFEACTSFTNSARPGAADVSADFDVAPTQEAASAQCKLWLRRFWSRDPSPAETEACAEVALESTSEIYGGGAAPVTQRAVDANRRWAYACATALTATGFLTY